MISMLRQGNNGQEIINILESLVNDIEDNSNKEPTLNPIEF